MPNSIADHKTSFLNLHMAPGPEAALPVPGILPPARAKHARHFRVGGIIGQGAILVLVALLSLGCYLAVSRYLFQTVEVVGQSMVPTLHPGSHYLLNRTAYRQSPPQRGDVVVIHDPGDHGFSVKRIIALEGETVHFLNGKVYVNTEPLSEPYLLPGTFTFTYSQAKEQLITCGKDQYFVLGDNRLVSVDSRSYGPVSRADILGRVVLHQ